MAGVPMNFTSLPMDGADSVASEARIKSNLSVQV